MFDPRERGSGLRRRAARILVATTVALCAAVIAITFWREDLRYSLPTPRPADLVQPPPGKVPELPTALAARLVPRRPTLVHFYRQECPCSRFQAEQLHALLREFGARVTFVAVLEDTSEEEFLEQGFGDADDPAGARIAVLRDPAGAIARALGVYSTPQAVVLTDARVLWYRGNYNVSRYCVDRETQFARIALDALLRGVPLPPMPELATVSYGCELPSVTSQESMR